MWTSFGINTFFYEGVLYPARFLCPVGDFFNLRDLFLKSPQIYIFSEFCQPDGGR